MNLKSRGYNNCILRVNLTDGVIEREPLPEKAVRPLLGGKGLGAYLLLKELPPHMESLSPENRLILNVGPLTGTTAPTGGRLGSTTKSPATGTYSDAYCGGFIGQTIKYAGYDAVILQGATTEPVMLVIDDAQVEIRSAAHIWGQSITQASEHLKEEFGPGWQTLVIGPAGEHRTNIAGIFNETRALARGGVGAVMGSKKLKAIVVRGTGTVAVADRDGFGRSLQLATRAIRMSSSISRMKQDGTANILEFINAVGALPTRNFRQGQFEAADEITGSSFRQHEWQHDYACFGCPIACSKVTRPVDGKPLEGPEYETTFSFGSNCAIGDREAIIRMSQLCDEYGIDTISAGGIVGFVMELFENGILTPRELDGLQPRFGDCRTAVALVDKMARVEGCGEWLSQGVAKIAASHPEAAAYAMQVKGLEMPAYHPNAAKGIGLGYAISERGACHLRGAPLSEVLGGADPLTTQGKAQLFRDHQAESALWNSAVLCCFPGFGMNLKELWQLVNAGTGFEYGSVREFELIGERINTLCRLFNTREGFDRRQDILPIRNLNQPLADGPARGQVVELDRMLDEYYQRMGWNENGIPTRIRIHELGLDELLAPQALPTLAGEKEVDE